MENEETTELQQRLDKLRLEAAKQGVSASGAMRGGAGCKAGEGRESRGFHLSQGSNRPDAISRVKPDKSSLCKEQIVKLKTVSVALIKNEMSVNEASVVTGKDYLI